MAAVSTEGFERIRSHKESEWPSAHARSCDAKSCRNAVPSGTGPESRASVLECSSPLELWGKRAAGCPCLESRWGEAARVCQSGAEAPHSQGAARGQPFILPIRGSKPLPRSNPGNLPTATSASQPFRVFRLFRRPSSREVEKSETGEAVEIAVEGDEAAAGGGGEGGQPGIRPALRGEVGSIGPGSEL